VQTVRYLYAYFKSQVLELCDRNTAGNSGTYKNHYRIGVVDAIREKLQAQKQKTYADLRAEHAANSMALVRVNNAIAKQERRLVDVDDVIKRMFSDGELCSGTNSGYANGSTGGREHGQRDGRNVRMTSARAGIGRGVSGLIK
jgi:hypothetical protein